MKYVSLGPCSTPMSAHHLFEKGINLAPVAESEECNSSMKAPVFVSKAVTFIFRAT